MRFRFASANYDATGESDVRTEPRKGEARMDGKIEDPFNDPIAQGESVVVGHGDD